MKKDRKNIILESLASMLEERNMSKVTTALLAEKSGITEAALYRHFPSKRAIYAELFSFCDNAIFSKCNELKKEKLSSKDKIKNSFLFFMIFHNFPIFSYSVCTIVIKFIKKYFGENKNDKIGIKKKFFKNHIYFNFSFYTSL